LPRSICPAAVIAFLCSTVGAFASVSDAATIPVHAASASPGPLDDGPHLFLDDALIAESRDVSFTLHTSEKFNGNPILTGKNPLTALDKVSGPSSVVYDRGTSSFRMWYTPHSRTGLGFHMGYATSADGIAWSLPDLGIVEFQGNRHNNLVVREVIGGDVLFDPRTANPAERYKSVSYRHDPKPVGFSVSFSPDGLHWSPLEWVAELEDPEGREGIGASDVVNAFYDLERNEFVAIFKMWSREGEYTIPVKRGVPPPTCARRIVGVSRSTDFRHWSKARVVLRADQEDPPTLEFYGVRAVLRRGGLFIGFLPCLIDDAPPDGIGWTELMVSRDGDTWQRIRQPFLPQSTEDATAPDHAMAWVSGVTTVGDKEYVYYSGLKEGHKTGERSGCLATLRKDGFVSVDGGANGGSLTTRPFSLVDKTGRTLTLNANAKRGEIRVQLCSQGKPIDGYAFADCSPVVSDGVAMAVSWKAGNQVPISEQPVQIEFQIRDGSLYSFGFAKQ